MGWEVYPEGLTELLVRMHTDYPVPPLYVTENGGAFKDLLQAGHVHDADRTDYIARHIEAVAEAMRQGVRMEGYMVWSLLDNFEWASGYAKRFGIVHVDYATQKRTLKDSAIWYAAMLNARNGHRSQSAAAVSAL
jgi:beta-glucosidase